MKIDATECNANEVFQFLRQGLNLTQKELSKILGISKSSIEKYEYGTVNYTFETLIDFIKKFNGKIIIQVDKKNNLQS